MKIEKMQKIISIILITILMVFMVNSVVMAVKPNDFTEKSVDTTDMEQAGKNIVKILQSIGVVVSVVALIIIGIKYLLGSVQEKAEYKKTMMPYIIGFGLTFTASIFAQLAYDFFSKWS